MISQSFQITFFKICKIVDTTQNQETFVSVDGAKETVRFIRKGVPNVSIWRKPVQILMI